MKNKFKAGFLVLALSALLSLSACNLLNKSNKKESSGEESSVISSESENSSSESSNTSSETSSSDSSSSDSSSSDSSSSDSEVPVTYHQVTFIVEDTVVQTSQVEDGGYAVYEGPTPTKMASGDILRYRFKGWDRDLSLPIKEDTIFTALFSGYKSEIMIDDFEDIEDSPSLLDEGWVALTYSSSGWTTETKASVSLGTKSVEGQKSLRFDAWENQTDYKFAKIFNEPIPYAANAMKFRLMIPSINTVKVLIHCAVNIGGTIQAPYFSYNLKPDTSEFVEYTIPLNDPNWAMWGEAGKSIAFVADWTGVHEDDILNYLTRIEFYANGNDGIQGQPYIAFLDSIRFVTLDSPSASRIETMGSYNRYTGLLNNGKTVSIEIADDNSATAKIVDLEVPQTINGTVTKDLENKTFSFVSNDSGQTLTYNGRLVNGSQQIKFVSATGTYADAVENVDLNSVQVVDNYEQYTEDGKAYYLGNPYKNLRSGARGAYYGEYYSNNGSDNTEWGGNKWSLLGGNGDQLKLKQDPSGAHSGNNYICMKNSKENALRYMQWGIFDGTSEQNAFRGNKLSFWAKTSGVVPAFKVAMYSQTSPKNATKDSYVKQNTFTPDGILEEWTHYEIELNPKLVYYGFLVFMEKNSSADSYLYIDDVEVYTANPYAKYEAPLPDNVLTQGLSFTGKANGLIKAQLDVNSYEDVTLSFPGLDASQDGKYVIDDSNKITMTFGEVQYVGNLNDSYTEITFVSVTNNGAMSAALNGLDFQMIDYADNAETYKNDGTMYYQGNSNASARTGARGAYYCEYAYAQGSSPLGGAGWILMGGNGDQLQLDKVNSFEGHQSLKMKQSNAGIMRYFQWGLYDGTAEGHTGNTEFHIFLKNSNSFTSSLKIMLFKVQHLTTENLADETNRLTKEIELAGNTDWTEYTISLDPNETYYGYAIEFAKHTSFGYINVDFAYYSTQDNDPKLNFYTVKNLTLTGTTLANEASMTFDDNGVAYFTCSGLGKTNVEGTFKMTMDGNDQIMTIVVDGNTITGTYSVAMDGTITFKVTSVTGALATYVEVNTLFQTQLV